MFLTFSGPTLLFTGLAVLDFVLDVAILMSVGQVCIHCAAALIWIINIIYLPFYLLAWVQRFFVETFGLIIDGWMLLFNFSGCYVFFGRHCWSRRA